ncbi:uncharacterized protein LOC127184748 [Acomys russatus]|uniref:uncharacterized protein LOC127184748 n=1 Tax=Acomys russatus TaxID=60746 RepID=UPI0021E301DD|nr:uncharacterized protein LOC127184748 [Acomys russatus]
MGDHKLPGKQVRRTVKPTSRDTSSKSVGKDASKCALKHKKEQLRLPTPVEGQHRLYIKERPDDFRKAGTPNEGLTPKSVEGTFLPTISQRVPSPIANKCQRKVCDDSGLYQPLLPVQHTRRTFWDEIGSRRNHHLLAPWPRGEDSSADILIKILETPRPQRILENKWPYWEDHREATKQPTNSGKQSQGKFDQDPHNLSSSCEGSWVPDGQHRGQDMLSSIYYKYIYKGGDDKWAKTCRNFVQPIDKGCENQPSNEKSPVKKPDLKYDKKMSRVENTRLSKQESSFVIKLQNPPDTHKVNKDIRYEPPSHPKSCHLKNEDLVPNSDEPELQGKNVVGNPEVAEASEPKDLKYFISKDDTTPSTLEQVFMKKGWGCEYSSPTSEIFRDYYWITDTDDDDDDEEEEEEKMKEKQKEKT